MERVTVRPYEERDADGFFDVRAIVYNDGWPVKDREGFRTDLDHFVAELDGKISGIFSVLPHTATCGPATLKCGAVASVAVAPDARRSGIGGAMMRWYIQHAAENGVPLASLYGFREIWYRRFGYEVAGKRLRIICPAHRLPDVPDSLPVRRLAFEDWRELAACYLAFAHARSGLNTRDAEWQWKRVLAENKPLTIYAFGDPVESYVAVSHQTAFWVEQSISEFVWSTTRGYESALSFFRQLAMNKTTVAWFEPMDGPFYSRYLDQGIEVRIDRPTMFRLNDVVAALQAIVPSGSGSFQMRVLDDTYAANDSIWRVSFGDGSVSVELGDDEDFTLDVRQLIQVFLGEPSLHDLLRQGSVSVRNADPVGDALRLFTPRPTVCMDFF